MSINRINVIFLLAALPCLAAPQSATRAGSAPLPDPSDLMQRAIANEAKLAAEQERYECRVTDDEAELNI
jgi:hypothetical protein